MQPDPVAKPDDIVVEIKTTFPSRAAAAECGDRLVRGGLAACVQISGPLTSVYRWQGVVETTEEFACHCKTTLAAATACEREIRNLHPYTTPEILVIHCRGSADYAAWVRENATFPREGAS